MCFFRRIYSLIFNKGPDSQEVSLGYQYSFNEYLVGARNFIVAIVDGRGTGGKGLKFLMKHTYKKLGIVEIEVSS